MISPNHNSVIPNYTAPIPIATSLTPLARAAIGALIGAAAGATLGLVATGILILFADDGGPLAWIFIALAISVVAAIPCAILGGWLNTRTRPPRLPKPYINTFVPPR